MIAPPCNGGPYEILTLLGEGGGGHVYRAWDPRLQREVALKVLRQRSETDPERVRRFVAEARAASALNHPNILIVFDAAVDGDTPFIVSECADYESGAPSHDSASRSALPATSSGSRPRNCCGFLQSSRVASQWQRPCDSRRTSIG